MLNLLSNTIHHSHLSLKQTYVSFSIHILDSYTNQFKRNIKHHRSSWALLHIILILYSLIHPSTASNFICDESTKGIDFNLCPDQNIICDPDEDCTIICSTTEACSSKVIHCPTDHRCELHCINPIHTRQCHEITIRAESSSFLLVNATLGNLTHQGTDNMDNAQIYCPQNGPFTSVEDIACHIICDGDDVMRQSEVFAVEGFNDVIIDGTAHNDKWCWRAGIMWCKQDLNTSCPMTSERDLPFRCNPGQSDDFTCNTHMETFSPTTSTPTTNAPTTSTPSITPSNSPTDIPSNNPSISPTSDPTTTNPTYNPTIVPSITPSIIPTNVPTSIPTLQPTVLPSIYPSINPTDSPSFDPTIQPTSHPTMDPTVLPSTSPTFNPTVNPITLNPTPIDYTSFPTDDPTVSPTDRPSVQPTIVPTFQPTLNPVSTASPSFNPTFNPSTSSTTTTFAPSIITTEPTITPSPTLPTVTDMPTSLPTTQPTTSTITFIPTIPSITSRPSESPLPSRPTISAPTSSPTDNITTTEQASLVVPIDRSPPVGTAIVVIIIVCALALCGVIFGCYFRFEREERKKRGKQQWGDKMGKYQHTDNSEEGIDIELTNDNDQYSNHKNSTNIYYNKDGLIAKNGIHDHSDYYSDDMQEAGVQRKATTDSFDTYLPDTFDSFDNKHGERGKGAADDAYWSNRMKTTDEQYAKQIIEQKENADRRRDEMRRMQKRESEADNMFGKVLGDFSKKHEQVFDEQVLQKMANDEDPVLSTDAEYSMTEDKMNENQNPKVMSPATTSKKKSLLDVMRNRSKSRSTSKKAMGKSKTPPKPKFLKIESMSQNGHDYGWDHNFGLDDS